jgi:outer membrane protein OmpA-like peptidoglycan-associated protein
VNLGYAKEKVGFATAGWDYKDLSSKADLEYIPPTPLSGGGEAAGDLNIDDTILSFEIRFQPNQIDFPPETYAMDFKRFCETQATFGNAAIVIEGHADTTLAVANFFWAARAKGLITGESGNYKFKGKPLKLTDTAEIIQAIQSENLAGQQRRNNRGQIVPVDDPKRTVAAALTLSQSRAERVKEAIEKYAKDHGYKINLKAVLPQGIGIAKPVNALPRNSEQRAENRRVLFRVVKTQAELTGGDFPFDEK